MEMVKLDFGLTEEQRNRLREMGCGLSTKGRITAEMIAAVRTAPERRVEVAKRRNAILEVRALSSELEIESLRAQLERERATVVPTPFHGTGWALD